MTTQDRLFVPLNTRPYRAFERGDKTVELRGVNDRFNWRTVRPGSRVELRRGYATDDSLWGTIRWAAHYDALDAIPWALAECIAPGASSYGEFLRSAGDLIGDYDRYIAFRVVLDE